MLLELAIVGAVVSAIVQAIKMIPDGKWSKFITLAILVVISFAAALIMVALEHYNVWSQFLGIVASANTIYAFVIQHFEDKQTI